MDINEVLKNLKDDYSLRNNLRRKKLLVHEELEDEIDDLEQSYVTSCIMPQLEAYAKDMLKELECEIYLSIQKDANGNIQVSNEYDSYLQDQADDNEDTLTPSDDVNERYVDRNTDETTSQNTRARSIRFSVKFKDGKTVHMRDAKDTFIETLRIIGFEKTAEFKGRLFNGFPLVGRKERTDGKNKWQQQVGEWFVYINMSNDTKIKMLKMISDEFHLGLLIEQDI